MSKDGTDNLISEIWSSSGVPYFINDYEYIHLVIQAWNLVVILDISLSLKLYANFVDYTS